MWLGWENMVEKDVWDRQLISRDGWKRLMETFYCRSFVNYMHTQTPI